RVDYDLRLSVQRRRSEAGSVTHILYWARRLTLVQTFPEILHDRYRGVPHQWQPLAQSCRIKVLNRATDGQRSKSLSGRRVDGHRHAAEGAQILAELDGIAHSADHIQPLEELAFGRDRAVGDHAQPFVGVKPADMSQGERREQQFP